MKVINSIRYIYIIYLNYQLHKLVLVRLWINRYSMCPIIARDLAVTLYIRKLLPYGRRYDIIQNHFWDRTRDKSWLDYCLTTPFLDVLVFIQSFETTCKSSEDHISDTYILLWTHVMKIYPIMLICIWSN